jgi:hypothetical protein
MCSLLAGWSIHFCLRNQSQRTLLHVISYIGVTEDSCWGSSSIIFAPHPRKDSAQGFKCRYIPKLDSCSFQIPMYPVQKGWSKEDVCTDIMQTVKNWVYYSNKAVFAYDMSEYEIPLFYYLMQEVPLSKFPFLKTSDLRDGLEQFLVSRAIVCLLVICGFVMLQRLWTK